MTEILEAIGGSGFSMLFKQSTTLYTATLAFHSIGLAFAVGISSGIALRVLGVAPMLPLAPLEDFCPLMTAGFWISAVTGAVLLVLDPVRFIPDATLYIKLGAIVVAMVLIRRLRAQVFGPGATVASPHDVARAKTLATRLLVVWGVAIVSGKVMAYDWIVETQAAVASVIFTAVALLAGYGAVRLGWIKPFGRGA